MQNCCSTLRSARSCFVYSKFEWRNIHRIKSNRRLTADFHSVHWHTYTNTHTHDTHMWWKAVAMDRPMKSNRPALTEYEIGNRASVKRWEHSTLISYIFASDWMINAMSKWAFGNDLWYALNRIHLRVSFIHSIFFIHHRELVCWMKNESNTWSGSFKFWHYPLNAKSCGSKHAYKHRTAHIHINKHTHGAARMLNGMCMWMVLSACMEYQVSFDVWVFRMHALVRAGRLVSIFVCIVYICVCLLSRAFSPVKSNSSWKRQDLFSHNKKKESIPRVCVWFFGFFNSEAFWSNSLSIKQFQLNWNCIATDIKRQINCVQVSVPFNVIIKNIIELSNSTPCDSLLYR